MNIECQTINKSAFTAHNTRENHIIDQERAETVGRKPHTGRRHQVREAIWILGEGRGAKGEIKRDECNCQLTHIHEFIIQSGQSVALKKLT